MASLRDLQSAFADAVFAGHTSRIATMVASNGIPAEERVGIYRNNTQIGFANALAVEFPIIVKLGGEEWFDQTARMYQRSYPSRSGNLHHVGASFPDYLRSLFAETEYAYFGDVAELEWAYQEVLVAEDHPSLDLAALACVAEGDYKTLKFNLHPAIRLVASNYPILDLWREHKNSGSTSRIEMTESQRVLVQRREVHVDLRNLSRPDFRLLQAFADGQPLEAALASALEEQHDFDAAAALPRFARLGVFCGFELSMTSQVN